MGGNICIILSMPRSKAVRKHCSVFSINNFTELQVLSAHCVNVEVLIAFEHDDLNVNVYCV